MMIVVNSYQECAITIIDTAGHEHSTILTMNDIIGTDLVMITIDAINNITIDSIDNNPDDAMIIVYGNDLANI